MQTEFVTKLQDIAGDANVLYEPGDLGAYSHDEYATDIYGIDPLAVVKPQSETQISEIVKLCAEMNIPVTVRGGGTGLSAACVPSENGIVLSLEKLNQIVEVDEKNHTITAQAGVTLKAVFDEIEKAKLYFPPHPGDESACVGGVVATNAGGARAVKYGTIKRFVLGLRTVLANGQIIDIGGKLIKSSSGYNLLGLMLGSEGTLGIITQVTFALLSPPGCSNTLVVSFRSIADAIRSVNKILTAGIIPTAVEFVENSVLRCAEKLVKKNWPSHDGEAYLLIIQDGTDEEEVLSRSEGIANVVEENGAIDVLLAEHKERQEEILQIRSMIYEALRPATAELFDICVPRSEIAEHVEFVHSLEDKYRVPLPTYGHAADGNVHTHFMHRYLIDGDLGDQIANWRQIHKDVRTEIYNDAIRRGGVISGEHGIGLAKKDYLIRNFSEDYMTVMKAIKKALDPNGILNPGKIFDL